MKRANIVVLLLLTNLFLVLVLAWSHHRARSSVGQEGADPAEAAASSLSGVSQIRVVKTNVLETNVFQWKMLEAEDYRTYIARLRSIGCPEQTIRDLVIADVDKLFTPRLQSINPAAREISYWQAESRELEGGSDYLERVKQQRQVDFEKRQVLHDLLGIDLVAERNKVQGAEDQFGRRLGFLPDDKRTQVRMLLEQFNEEEVSIRQKTWEDGEPLTDDDRARLQQLEQQREAGVSNVLSKAEFDQYQLALSPMAMKVRDSLFGMNANESEYLAVYSLQKVFESQWPGGKEPSDPQQRVEWEQARAELETQLKQKLGESRYAEYQRAQDPDFREISIACARCKVPASTAAEVYEYKQVVLEQRARIAGNRSLTPSQQETALQAMAAETEQTVRTALGDRAYNQYLRSGKGSWIRSQPGE